MIEHRVDAVRIQQARATAGKFGFAKAVQRYIKRTAFAEKVHLTLAYLSFPAPVVRKPKPGTKKEATE